MFNLRDFVKKGLLDAIGKMADYQIILNALGWYEKGVLLEGDLDEINQAIEDSHKQPEITEEIVHAVAEAILEQAEEENKTVEEIIDEIVDEVVDEVVEEER